MTTPDYGRAGRNLPAAIAVGVGLLALVTVALFVDQLIFALLAAVVAVLGVRELANATVVGLSSRMATLLKVCAPVIVILASSGSASDVLFAYVASVIAVLSLRLLDGQEAYVHHVTRSIFVLTYVPLLISFAVLLSAQSNGSWKVMAFILLTTATDLGAYIAGVLFGKTPMAPKISPKKTWEGFAGAFVLQMITGATLWVVVFDESWLAGAIVGVVMLFAATVGDLIESMIKRDLGIKDMSSFLPGHGGVMDRLDSLLINAFFAWVLFNLFL